MPTNVIFWGGTGHARVVREDVDALGHRIVAVFDNNPDVQSPFPDVPIYHGEAGFQRWCEECPQGASHAVVAIAGHRGLDRLRIQRWLKGEGFPPLTLIHATAYVARGVEMGEGVHLTAGAYVCAEARLGDAVVVNSLTVIGHDSIIEDGVHISAGAVVSGEVKVGAGTFAGVGSLILPRLRVGARCIIGAGAVVTKDLPDGAVVRGSPAKVVGDSSERRWTI